MKHGLRALIGDTRLPVGPEERPDDLMESSSAISVMRVQLFSQDRGLYRLCREILSEIAGESWTVSVASPEEAADSCDLTLWDFQPELLLPEWIASSPSQHLFLVERKDLTCFRERT